MIFETILLNRLHKSNQFSRLKPRILEDRVVFAITDNLKLCSSGNLTKAQPTDLLCSTAETEEYFDCKTAESGDILYLGMELQFAYQVMHICSIEKLYSEEQMSYCQYWIGQLYSDLQDPLIEKETNLDDDQEAEKIRHFSVLSEKAQQVLQNVENYLLTSNFMVPHNLTFADIFLVSILKRKDLLKIVKESYNNIQRVVNFVLEFFSCDVEKLFNQETKIFQNIHHHTSSAQFIQAIRKNDLEQAKQIALENPWAVNGREPHDQQLTCPHIAVKNRDMSLLHFLEQFPQVNFDMGDCDGETPLFYSLSSKQLEMTKFFVSKGANLSHKSSKRGWSPLYVAATLSSIESLEYLVSLGCDVNLPTFIGRTALTKTCWMGREDSVKVLLKHPKIDLEWKANSQRTALQHAVWGPYGGKDGIKHGTNPKDSPACAKLLLEAGADPMNRDVKGKTPLHTACQTGGADCVPLLLDYGADINARLNSGGTPLHSCCYFGNQEPFLALLKYVETHPMIKIDTEIRQAQGYTPIESTIPNDQHEFVEFLIQQENYILQLGLRGLTFGNHNYNDIFTKCLKHNSFKSMNILLDKYKREKQNCVDLVNLVSLALQHKHTPDVVVAKLFNFLTEQNKNLSIEKKLKLLWGFCKSETITDESDIEILNCIDKLLIDIESLPIQIVKMGIKMNKYLILQKLFASLRYINKYSLSKHESENPLNILLQFKEQPSLSDFSILSLAMQAGNDILRLLLEETNIRVDERQENGDTYIHEACRMGVDMQILETLLINLRQLYPEPDQLQKFLEQKNNDGISPLDYCMLKNRYDMGVVLNEFVVTSQSIVDIKQYKIVEQFRLKDFASTDEYLKLKSLDLAAQYSTQYEPYKFISIQNTQFEWIDSDEKLMDVSIEIENALQTMNVLAVDLEYHNVQRQATVLSLIQLSTYNKDYIIDSLQLRNLDSYDRLRSIFQNQNYVKVFHGGDTDIQLLASDLDICTINVFDTARAYQFLQRLQLLVQLMQSGKTVEKLSLNFISLEKITKLFLNVDLDKTFQVADWRIRPLPKGMLDYARNDSHYLIPIYMIILDICKSHLQSESIPKSLLEQEWYVKAKQLPYLDQFDILGQMALMTNKFIIAKLCKNNYNRVVVQN